MRRRGITTSPASQATTGQGPVATSDPMFDDARNDPDRPVGRTLRVLRLILGVELESGPRSELDRAIFPPHAVPGRRAHDSGQESAPGPRVREYGRRPPFPAA